MKDTLLGLLKSKTALFNVVMGLIGLLGAFGVFGELNPAPTGEQVSAAFSAVEAAYVAVWTVGGVFLRALTKEPVAAKAARTGG